MDPATITMATMAVTSIVSVIGALVAAFKIQSDRIASLEKGQKDLVGEHVLCREENATMKERMNAMPNAVSLLEAFQKAQKETGELFQQERHAIFNLNQSITVLGELVRAQLKIPPPPPKDVGVIT